MQSRFLAAAVLTAALAVAAPAAAQVTVIGTPAEFDTAAGSRVRQGASFGDSGNLLFLPTNPWVSGLFTFSSPEGAFVGSATDFTYNRPLLFSANDYGLLIELYEAAQIDLLSFEFGNFAVTAPVGVMLSTNLGVYEFYPTVGFAGDGSSLTFQGFRAGAGEYFTKAYIVGLYTGVTNIQVVELTDWPDAPPVAAVPEPATWAMMILGFGVIGGALRSRRRATVRVAYN